MLKGTYLQRRHLRNRVSASSFSIFLRFDLIDGYAPGVVLGTKYDEAIVGLVIEIYVEQEPIPLP